MARVGFVFALGIVGISFAAIFVRFALPATPVITGFYRMLLATSILGAYLGLKAGWSGLRVSAQLRTSRATWLCLAAGAFFACDLALWQTATVETSVANATLLVNTTPIYVGLISYWILGQRLSFGFFAGAGLAILGCGLLVGVQLDQPLALGGNLKAGLAAVFYSIYLVGMKRARESLDATYAICIAGVGATVVFGLMGLALGHDFTGFPTRSWVAIVCAAVISHLCGALSIAWSLRYLHTTFASVGLIGQSICTAALGWLLLGEAITLVQAFGGALLMVGIWIAARDGASDSPHRA